VQRIDDHVVTVAAGGPSALAVLDALSTMSPLPDAFYLLAYLLVRGMPLRAPTRAGHVAGVLLRTGTATRPQLLALLDSILAAEPMEPLATIVVDATVAAEAPVRVCERAHDWVAKAAPGSEAHSAARRLLPSSQVRHRGTGKHSDAPQRPQGRQGFFNAVVDRYLVSRLVQPRAGSQQRHADRMAPRWQAAKCDESSSTRAHAMSILRGGYRPPKVEAGSFVPHVRGRDADGSARLLTPRERQLLLVGRATHVLPVRAVFENSVPVLRGVFPELSRRHRKFLLAGGIGALGADRGDALVTWGPQAAELDPVLGRAVAKAWLAHHTSARAARAPNQLAELPAAVGGAIDPVEALSLLRIAGGAPESVAGLVAAFIGWKSLSAATLRLILRSADAAYKPVPVPAPLLTALVLLREAHAVHPDALQIVHEVLPQVDTCAASPDARSQLSAGFFAQVSAFSKRLPERCCEALSRRFAGPSRDPSMYARRVRQLAQCALLDMHLTARDLPAAWYTVRSPAQRRQAVVRCLAAEGAALTALLFKPGVSATFAAATLRRDLRFVAPSVGVTREALGNLSHPLWTTVADEVRSVLVDNADGNDCGSDHVWRVLVERFVEQSGDDALPRGHCVDAVVKVLLAAEPHDGDAELILRFAAKLLSLNAADDLQRIADAATPTGWGKLQRNLRRFATASLLAPSAA
jgi:hypothetical protein